MNDAAVKAVEREVEKGAWSEIFGGGLGLYSTLVIGGVAMQATQMLVIAIIMPTIVADIGGADYYTWTAMLYTIGAIVGGASTGTVWARLGARRSYMLGALVFALGTVSCALAPGIGSIDRGAYGAGLGRRAGGRQRHGADHQPLQRKAADPHHCHVAGHVHRLSPERSGGRRHVRGNELVARLVLGNGAVHAGFRRHCLCTHS